MPQQGERMLLLRGLPSAPIPCWMWRPAIGQSELT